VAPPGYAGYQAAPFGQVPLKRVKGLGVASSVIVLIAGALGLVELAAARAARDEARQFRDGLLTETEFFEQAAGYLLVTVLIGLVQVVAAIVSIIFVRRVASNLRTLHRGTTWGPGWAIGGWFAPPVLFVIPTLLLREAWKASDPDVPVGGDWRSRRGSPLPLVWFALYGLAPVVLLIAQTSSGNFDNVFGGSGDQVADSILDGRPSAVATAAISAAAAVAWFALVRSLSDRHRRLTGEAHAR
jgi:hypothetical protein